MSELPDFYHTNTIVIPAVHLLTSLIHKREPKNTVAHIVPIIGADWDGLIYSSGVSLYIMGLILTNSISKIDYMHKLYFVLKFSFNGYYLLFHFVSF